MGRLIASGHLLLLDINCFWKAFKSSDSTTSLLRTCIPTPFVMKLRQEKHQQSKPTRKLFLATVHANVKSFLCLRVIEGEVWKYRFNNLSFAIVWTFSDIRISGVDETNQKSITNGYRYARCFQFTLRLLIGLCCFFNTLSTVSVRAFVTFKIRWIYIFANCSMFCVSFYKVTAKFSEIMIHWWKLEKSLNESNFIEGFSEKWSLKRRVSSCATTYLC